MVKKGKQFGMNTNGNWRIRGFVVLLFSLFFFSQSFAQPRTCGVWNPIEDERISPKLQETYRRKIQAFQRQSSISQLRRTILCDSPIKLPIAVHFQGIINSNITCLRDLTVDQVALLNVDLQGQNSDTVTWMANAPNFSNVELGRTCIELVLANKNHPAGYGLQDGDLAITVNTTSGDFLSDWQGYINIVVVDIENNGLGYAPLGGIGNGDAVVVDVNAFGSFSCGQVSPQYPYDKGRTLVHELGHYLFLPHIWGFGGCNSDDGISDTPVSAEPHYGCPNLGMSCSSNDLHMNFMDYTNDACMYMFTAGQARVMENWVATNLQDLVNNIGNVHDSANCIDCAIIDCTDLDQDGYCDTEDCNDSDASVPAASGTICNDNNPNTYNDIIQMDGCTCRGIVDDCVSNGGDSDGDGICDPVDCQPMDACFPKPIGESCDDGVVSTINDVIQDDGCTCMGSITTTRIQMRLYLEGFYDENTRQLHDGLYDKNLIPLSQPYNIAPWSYDGNESVSTIPNDAVDWILIMSRDTQNTILGSAVGFINREGRLMDMEGNLGIELSNGLGNLISIHHRNHLAVITDSAYSSDLDLTFTDASVKGNEQLKNINGVYCLYAGDYDGSGIVNNQDYNNWATDKSALNQYIPIDGDGNGVVNNLDYNLWVNNGAKIGYGEIQY